MARKPGFLAVAAAALLAFSANAQVQDEPRDGEAASRAPVTGPIRAAAYHADFVKLGTPRADGVLYEPNTLSPKSRVAVVFTFPRATFGAAPASELAARGYRVLLVTPYSEDESPMDGIAETSRGVAYMRSLPGVDRVVVMSHSGGGRMMAFYADLAQNGPAACQHPGLLYKCKTEDASNLAKPDGLVLLDSAPGAFNTASSMDPAYDGKGRGNVALDMYAPANGYDPKTGAAKYSPEFIKRFFAAQSARNNQYIDKALARLSLIEQGKGDYADDEPFVVPGALNGGNNTSLYHTDTSLMSHTKRPHTLLKADGTSPEVIIRSVRPPGGRQNNRGTGTLASWSLNYSVKSFLANDVIRTTKDFAVTEDDIAGVDWKSGLRSTPGSAEGIVVPTLIMSMSCFHFVVPDEIVFDHLAAKDKTYASVEGANHGFAPCKPEYGDTRKRTFDFVDGWLSKPGRF